MHHFSYKDTTYEVDEQGFLQNPKFWDTNFAEGMAKECGIESLTSGTLGCDQPSPRGVCLDRSLPHHFSPCARLSVCVHGR